MVPFQRSLEYKVCGGCQGHVRRLLDSRATDVSKPLDIINLLATVKVETLT
jgi:hypothetical protein